MEDLRRRVQEAESRAEAAERMANNAMAAAQRTGVDPVLNLKPPFEPIMKDETKEDEAATDREIKRFFANADQVCDRM